MRRKLLTGIVVGIIRFVAIVLFSMVGWIKKNAKGVIMFATFFAAICCLSGIDAQMWQAIPGILLMSLFKLETVIWRGGE